MSQTRREAVGNPPFVSSGSRHEFDGPPLSLFSAVEKALALALAAAAAVVHTRLCYRPLRAVAAGPRGGTPLWEEPRDFYLTSLMPHSSARSAGWRRETSRPLHPRAGLAGHPPDGPFGEGCYKRLC